MREVPGIVAATPTASKGQTLVFGQMNHSVRVTGTDNAYFGIGGWTLAYGREFSEAELRSGTPVCVLGDHSVDRADRGGQSGGHDDPDGQDFL